jgi:Flp pilus assembly protein TadG
MPAKVLSEQVGEQKMSRADQSKARRCRSGQAVVEFALILPVFMLMLFGAIEFGRAYYTLHLLTNAAREGARTGSLPDKLESNVSAAVNGFLQDAGLGGTWSTSVVVTDSTGATRTGGMAAAVEGDRIHVTVSHDFHILCGRIIPGFSGTVPLRGRCVFRHE